MNSEQWFALVMLVVGTIGFSYGIMESIDAPAEDAIEIENPVEEVVEAADHIDESVSEMNEYLDEIREKEK